MRMLSRLAIVLLLLEPGALAATAATAPSKVPAAPGASGAAVAIPAGLTTGEPRLTTGQIAVCANLAAVRALDARSAGSGYDVQRRVLNLTFVLCLAGEDDTAVR